MPRSLRPRLSPGAESDRIANIGAAYMRFVARRPALARLMFGPQLPNRDAFPALGASRRCHRRGDRRGIARFRAGPCGVGRGARPCHADPGERDRSRPAAVRPRRAALARGDIAAQPVFHAARLGLAVIPGEYRAYHARCEGRGSRYRHHTGFNTWVPFPRVLRTLAGDDNYFFTPFLTYSSRPLSGTFSKRTHLRAANHNWPRGGAEAAEKLPTPRSPRLRVQMC